MIISSILLYVTFPVQVVQTGQDMAGESVALSLASLVFTWALLFAISMLASGDQQRTSRRGLTGRLLALRGVPR